MSFDISRSTFRPRKNFLGVVMQQGRVQLDSDWNEWQSEFSRRAQAGTLDTVGQAVYPASTPNAFKITPVTNANGATTLTIGAGRYYVDGLLAENHGPESQAAWDNALAELSGAPAYSNTSAATDFTQQPYLPGATLPDGSGPFLAYLDVWQRDVTYLEDPDLIDKAINVDTTARLQTIWQVKLLDLANSPNATCSTDIPAFDALLAPPAARLTNGLVPNAGSGPCCLAPNTGYTGQENQCYRVEIHQPGTPGAAPAGGYTFPLVASTPTFKWSRDNASVETSVSAISTVTTSSGPVSQLTVASLGRDSILGFRVNDWIEITDDAWELNGQPGQFFQITAVIAASRTLTLNGSVSAHFPLTNGQTDPKLHTRIRRWDQSAKVFQTDASGNTTLWIDLNTPGSTGQIPVPPPGVTLVLENGITVAFDLIQQPVSTFRTGDYWTFAARIADGSIEPITSAPPLGIHHHYARLSIVTLPSTATDCRIEWPPSATEADGCCCTVTVKPSDLKGDTTLQAILDKYQNQSTPITICLESGIYTLSAPLRLTRAHRLITIEACQPGAARFQALQGSEAQFSDGFIILDSAASVAFSGLTFLLPMAPYTSTSFAGLPLDSLTASVAAMVKSMFVSIGIRIVGGTSISITHCNIGFNFPQLEARAENAWLFAAGIFINGRTSLLTIENNEILALNTKIAASTFSTGVLLAPSVAFPPPIIIGVAEQPTRAASAELATAATKATKTKTRAATATVEAPVDTSALKLEQSTIGKLEESGVHVIGDLLQNLGGFQLNAAATLASQGGKVLAASLNGATLRSNTFGNLTVAALLFGEPGTLDAAHNTFTLCKAGVWILTPLQSQQLLTDPQNLSLLGTTAAFGYPLPQNSTAAPTSIAAAPDPTRIYAGVEKYTDTDKNLWLPDTATKTVTISGGNIYRPVPPPAIPNTLDPTLYQSERNGTFSYTFNNLPAGYYSLTLKFAEILDKEKGQRLFDVAINGVQVLTDFDIIADQGMFSADDKTYTGIAPNDAGQIVVQFTGNPNGVDHNAKISAVALLPQWDGSPYLGDGNESEAAAFFDQLAQLSMQAYAAINSPTTQVRFQDNVLTGLTAPGFILLGDDSPASTRWSSLTMTGNRIEGEIAPALRLATEFSAVFIVRAFYFLVIVINTTRAVVSANIVNNGNPVDGFRPSLYLDDTALPNPGIAVMSNVLTGTTRILPQRPNFDPALNAFVQTWNFLNTILR